MNLKKPLLVFIALIMLCCGGCSMISLGYNQADWILRYWITDYTSFNTAQKDEIYREVDSYLSWHRKEALPGYIAFLKDVNAAINQPSGFASNDVTRLRTESARLYQLTLSPMIRPAAHLLSTLDSRQIAELAKTFAKKNSKQRKKMLVDSEQKNLAMRAERHVELVEKMVGDLSSEQEAKITEMSLRIPFATRCFIEQREANQASLISLLNGKAGEAKIAEFLRRWLTAPESLRPPQPQKTIAAYESAMNGMTVQIFALLTPHQKQYLSEKITSYIDEFQQLH